MVERRIRSRSKRREPSEGEAVADHTSRRGVTLEPWFQSASRRLVNRFRLEANFKTHRRSRPRTVAERTSRRNPRPAGSPAHAAISLENHADCRSINCSPPFGHWSEKPVLNQHLRGERHGNRTRDSQISNLVLYPSELAATDADGLEPSDGTPGIEPSRVTRVPLDPRRHEQDDTIRPGMVHIPIQMASKLPMDYDHKETPAVRAFHGGGNGAPRTTP